MTALDNISSPRVTTDRSDAAPLVLIVDDCCASQALLKEILRAEGFQTISAMTAEQAISISRTAGVDLILLDVMLPDRSGLEVCAELKSNPVTTDIPVLFVSALDDVESRVRGLKAGAVDYITKPVFVDEVLARVRVHLRIRNAAQMQSRAQQQLFDELRQAQQSMLVTPDDVPDACFSVCYRPAEAVGGDIYDVLSLSADVHVYFVADVSGHSVGASFLTSAVKALLRQYTGPLFSPEDTMRGINSVMRSTLHSGYYLTACFARLSRRRRVVTVVSAGHPAPIHVSSAGSASTVEIKSDALGIFGTVVLHKQEIRLEAGDRIYLYTDGLIEDPAQPAGGRQSGIERLRMACQRAHALPLLEAPQAIVQALRPASVADDVLLLSLEFRP